MVLEYSVVPEVETMVSVRTIPRAVCFLYHNEAKDKRLQLDADDDGIVRFHAKAPKESEPIEIHLECTGEDGTKTEHEIVLSTDTHPSVPVTPGIAPTGQMQPPLEGDPMALSNEELLRRGYPPRPDPVKAPARYARWYRIVSRPFTRVNPRRVSHPGVSFSRPDLPPKLKSPTLPLPTPIAQVMFNSNSNIWSGASYTNPTGQFFWIEADWYVPEVSGRADTPWYSAAAEWIGLDSGGTDLYQAGTDSECTRFLVLSDWYITNYWMWIQCLPFDPWGVPNFPISPGDRISVDIFVADPSGNTSFQNGINGGLTQADNTVWFIIYNHTKGLGFFPFYTLPTEPGGGATGFTGTTAEFVIERPSVNKNPVPLANFGWAIMFACWYGDSEYGDRSWPNMAVGSSPFDANLTYLNMQDSSTGNILTFPFTTPDPNTDGYSIGWMWTNYF